MADEGEVALRAIAIILDEENESRNDEYFLRTVRAYTASVEEAVSLTRGKKRKRGDGDIPASQHAEIVASRMDDYSFWLHFRMKRSTFQAVLELLGGKLTTRHVPLENELLCSIWLLATQDSYRSVGQKFGMSKGTLHWVFLRICKALSKMAAEYILFPQPADFSTIASTFKKLAGFPGVIGCIDGTYIPIKDPNENRSAYICSKGFPALHLQGCCTADLQFSSITVGNAGSIHNARAYTTSRLYANLLENPLPSEYHLLGDSAYPLQMELLTPFRDNGHLTEEQIVFNQVHSSTRVVIDRAFGRLKGMFQRLKYIDMSLIEDMSDVVLAACTLHNIILQMQDPDDASGDEYPTDDCSDSEVTEHATDACDSAAAKRTQLALALHL